MSPWYIALILRGRRGQRASPPKVGTEAEPQKREGERESQKDKEGGREGREGGGRDGGKSTEGALEGHRRAPKAEMDGI